MVDHHTLMQGFWDWQAEEQKTRGYMPGAATLMTRLHTGCGCPCIPPGIAHPLACMPLNGRGRIKRIQSCCLLCATAQTPGCRQLEVDHSAAGGFH